MDMKGAMSDTGLQEEDWDIRDQWSLKTVNSEFEAKTKKEREENVSTT